MCVAYVRMCVRACSWCSMCNFRRIGRDYKQNTRERSFSPSPAQLEAIQSVQRETAAFK